MAYKFGEVIQVTDPESDWLGCLLMVDDAKEWGVLAGLKIPMQGIAYIRLEHGQYEYIGRAPFVYGGDNDD